MGFTTKDFSYWTVVDLPERVDSFNFNDFQKIINLLKSQGKKYFALNLQKVHFLSQRTIRYIASLSQELDQINGRIALLSPSEKLKRQLQIFANTEHFSLYRTREEWSSENMKQF